ncbi:MtrB/PioB family decaheme-associated outer membrane protein [Ferrimonas kyonanensis]|uniref:MtrB/PioB family decaheme-associated outer membrane protein n=1 Tax=Ferrimonas kyonanensis TaxID=364763 RepID=UPI0003F8C736|nr:MtrB/PioB family decaheme-associated outer membrane protein [Ferrimonas kyonanensis]
MKFQLSILALALMQAGVAQSAGFNSGFNLKGANTDKVNTAKWQCKRCEAPGAAGAMGVSAVWNELDDARAANDLGDDSELAAALQADAVYTGATRVKVQAHNLGMDTGSAQVSVSNERFGATVGYQSQLNVKADNAQSLYGLEGSDLVMLPSAQSTTLQAKREQWQLGSELKGQGWGAYVDYRLEEKTGQQASSTQLNRSPVNFARPIDSQTQRLNAGTEMNGDAWLASLHYQGSLFDNSNSSIDQSERGSLQALSPDNEAHQLIARGQYRFSGINVTGQLAKGWLYQDQDYVTLGGVPNGITHLNGKVQTTDARLNVSTKPAKGLKLRAKVTYRDRDNRTPERLFSSVDYDVLRGRTHQSVALDLEKTSYLVDARYRLSADWHLLGGYEHESVERNHSVREETDEDSLFAKLTFKGIDTLRIALKGELSSRDGSTYQASETTSSEDNPLLRKYHLADRDRTRAELKISHQPMDSLALDLSYRYAKDDYDQSELGLTESTDHGYDLALSYRFNPQLSLSLYGGQQWIDSSQLGSQSFATADWQADVEDSFSHIGLGGHYTGLMQDQLTLGLDYDYSESDSDTSVTGKAPFGDYTAWGHRAQLFADYAISSNATLRAQYRYLRGYDSDYTQVAPQAIPGLVTLGQTHSNYQAHQLMLTLSYAL